MILLSDWSGITASSLITHLVPVTTIWREASGEGAPGMDAVAWVIFNRMAKRHLSAASVCLEPDQFSSMTAKGDPGLLHWPRPLDDSFKQAWDAWMAVLGTRIPDPTQGADYYFAVSIPTPKWAAAYTFTAQIGHQRFYRS